MHRDSARHADATTMSTDGRLVSRKHHATCHFDSSPSHTPDAQTLPFTSLSQLVDGDRVE
eukprot:m.71621 g.71621  ORF g.71621 m.71621 type:complete len:60 (-) comp18648_c0_seq2:176-355(-)